MAAPSAPTASVTPIRVPVTAWLIVAFALIAVFVLLLPLALGEVGGSTAFAEQIHEFTHDGRHALGVPCH